MFNKSALFFIIAMCSIPSFAGWHSNQSIEYLYAGEVGGRYAVRVSGIQPNPDSCSGSQDLVIESSNTKLKEMWSMLLAAYISGKTVNFFLSGCGTLNQPVITDLTLGAPI